MTRAVIIVAVAVATYMGAVVLLEGPLAPWVPACRNIVVGFCFD